MRAWSRQPKRLVPSCESLDPRTLLSTGTLAGGAVAPLRAPSLFVEPQDGRAPILQAIASARQQIRLTICNLSDPIVGAALAEAAGRGVDVRVIVDRNDYDATPAERTLLTQLATQGVSIHLSNPIFHQSFEKGLLIDQRQVLIMTMCLVPLTFSETRDYGLVVNRPDIIGEVARVFETDWSHSAPPGAVPPPYNPTPPVRVPSLLWSPIDSRDKLARLIQQARRTIDATSEILGDPTIESDLIAAAHRGVRVRVIVPLSQRDVPNVNESSIVLLRSQEVDVHVTEGPAPSFANPYMHAKTMVVDDRLAYLGSIDLQASAMNDDRELGLLFGQHALVGPLEAEFQGDWARSQAPPPPVVSGPTSLAGPVGTPLSAGFSAGNDWAKNVITMSTPPGSLPPGLTFHFDPQTGQGILAGTPTAPGAYLVPITVANTVNQVVYSVQVNIG